MELRTHNTERATKIDSSMSYRCVKDTAVDISNASFLMSFIKDITLDTDLEENGAVV
jgi:hypothetical protein